MFIIGVFPLGVVGGGVLLVEIAKTRSFISNASPHDLWCPHHLAR
jgi:hypothetical protein